MNSRTSLSVGITQDFPKCELRQSFMAWLGIVATYQTDAANAIQHIEAIEGLLAAERYASLSIMADDMKNHLAEIRPKSSDDFNKGYQLAINLVYDKLEVLDVNAQCATSIAELQAAAILDAVTEVKNIDDYQAMVDYAHAICDGES